MKKPQPTPPNMTKEYRKELRGIDQRLRALAKEHRTILKANDRAISAVLRDGERQIRGLDKQAIGLERRKAILVGRLS